MSLSSAAMLLLGGLMTLGADGGASDAVCGIPASELGSRCAGAIAVPEGFGCWRSEGIGTGRWATWGQSTVLIDERSCRATGLIRSGGGGSPASSISFSELPGPGPPNRAERQRLLEFAGLARAQRSRADHALAFLQRDLALAPPGADDEVGREARPRRVPGLRWWPGAPPARFPDTWEPAEEHRPSAGEGRCPCYRAFSGSAFEKEREWQLGAARVVLYATKARNRTLAFLVAEKSRHRWIHYDATFGIEPQAYVQGATWWLAVRDLYGERTRLLGHDVRSGRSWRVDLGVVDEVELTEEGLEVESEEPGGPQRLPWRRLRP